jgi:threonine aldolase
VFPHGDNPQIRFERDLATFMQAEAGVLCQSGWCANTGLIQPIADSTTPVYIDMMAHISLWEGTGRSVVVYTGCGIQFMQVFVVGVDFPQRDMAGQG